MAREQKNSKKVLQSSFSNLTLAFYKLISKILFLSVLVVATIAGIYDLVFWQRIYPGVVVSGLYLGGKNEKEALLALGKITPPKTLYLSTQEKEFELPNSQIDLSYDLPKTVERAFAFGRTGSLEEKILARIRGATSDINLPLVFSYNQAELNKFLGQTSETLYIPAIEPEIKIEKGIVVVNPGKNGRETDLGLLEKRVKEALEKAQDQIPIPLITTSFTLTPQETEELSSRAEKLINATISFSFEEKTLTLTAQELVELLTPGGKYKMEKVNEHVERLSGQFSRPVQNPTFRFEGGKVIEFKPAKDGITVEKEKLTQEFLAVLETAEKEEFETKVEKKQSVTIPVITTKPQIKTGEVNTLGIQELLGRGTSRFRGSILSRVHNISIAASRLNGLLIPPGEVFSFNKALGDVSAFTGYQQAYIIKDGKTILGDGGGVCQVSSTLFRTVLNAGLPIMERRAHSYRVSYYEQDSGPGFDATVYDPTVDLKIKNDTPAHILIQATVDRKNMSLVFELYGTKDGRVATVSKPRVWNSVPPPPDLYQDDPTLPFGTIKQVDFKAAGAKVAFDYYVKRGSEVFQDRAFYSVYHPWQAVYLRGIAPQ